MKLFFGAVCALLITAFATPLADAQARIGVVDVDAVMVRIPAAKEALARLETTSQARAAEFDRRGAGLRELVAELEAQRLTLSNAEITRREEQIMQAQLELQANMLEAQSQMDSSWAEERGTVMRDVTQTIDLIRQNRGLDLVISTDSVLSYSGSIDVTEEVIAALGG